MEPTIYSSDDDDEPLVPVLFDSMSTVPSSIGALRVGVEIREFSRSVVPDSGSRLAESDLHIRNSARHRFSGCPVVNVTEGPTQLDSDTESPVATLVGVQPTGISEACDCTIADSDQSESPVVQASRGRRRVIREDSSEDEGPGPILLRRGRFAALVEDDTESVDNHSRAEEEATQEIPARRRRRLRILWQEPAEVERVTCAPTQVEPDSHEELLARVQQAVGHPWHRLAPDVREVRAAIQVFRQLVRRVGPMDPRAIRHQHWSVVFVPLMWAAACCDRECPVFQWLGRAAACGPPIVVGAFFQSPLRRAPSVQFVAGSLCPCRQHLINFIHSCC